MKKMRIVMMIVVGMLLSGTVFGAELTYPIVDTGVSRFYNTTQEISAPQEGDVYYKQDAYYQGNAPAYRDNNDGTITDTVTGLMWQKDMGDKCTYDEALKKAKALRLGGYDDWRIPTIKELYSLIQFTGRSGGTKADTLYIDTKYFIQPIGDVTKGEREIDAQTWSSTRYCGKSINGMELVFGVNFIDGRIKGYPNVDPRTRQEKQMYFRMVRGNKEYGNNNFIDNGDGTVSDYATGLMWQKSDDGTLRDWPTSLQYASKLDLAGYSDWRLPDAKELQSIVDYSRSPSSTNSAAIDPVFTVTAITDPSGKRNYPYYWTSTTHLDGRNPGDAAVYIAFGEAQGKMHERLIDIHGAGAQRSDPKTGNSSNYPQYRGPQGDVRYVYNAVRCVRTFIR